MREGHKKKGNGSVALVSGLMALFISLFLWLVSEALAIAGFIVIFIVLFVFLRYENAKDHYAGGRNHITVIAKVLPTEIRDSDKHIRVISPERHDYYEIVSEFEGIQEEKGDNKNIQISGSAGSGKSFLTRWILQQNKNRQILFSPKADDHYLRMGYKIIRLDRNIPNPFLNPKGQEAFVKAFAVAFTASMSSKGITVASVSGILMDIAKRSGSWEQFRKTFEAEARNERDNVRKMAFAYAQGELSKLYPETGNEIEEIPIPKMSVVLDFSMLNDDARVFFEELTLRLMWAEIVFNKERNLLIVCDEAHELLTAGGRNRDRSILYTMAREIRAFGSLMVISQNYVDIEKDVRNQFKTQFVFQTKHPDDLKDIAEINEALRYTVAECLANREFMDVWTPSPKKEVPIYTLYEPSFVDYPETEYQMQAINEEAGSTESKGKATNINYETEIEAILNEKVSWISQMGKDIAKVYGLDPNKVKSEILSTIGIWKNQGKIGELPIDRDREGKLAPLKLLYLKGKDNPSKPHEWIVDRICERLDELGIPYTRNSFGQSGADIETPNFDVEIETGLKNRNVKDLLRRQNKSEKTIYIVIPNLSLRKQYPDGLTIPLFKELSLK